MKRSVLVVAAALIVAFLANRGAWAQNAGQEDLDKATEVKLSATTLRDLARVVELSESALAKGLDAENTTYAKQLIAGTLYQRAAQICQSIFDLETPDPRWPLMRRLALDDLEKVVKTNDQLGEAWLLMGKLQLLPGGDRDKARQALDHAAEVSKNRPSELSEVLVYRAALQEDATKKLADLSEAIRLNSKNVTAWRDRAIHFLSTENYDAAVADFKQLLANDADNVVAHEALAEALTNMQKFDEAKKHCDEAIRLAPDQPLGYALRARVRILEKDLDGALQDLDKAIDINPRDVPALLARARLYAQRNEAEKSRQDVERLLELRPGLSQALVLRSMLTASEGHLDDAIADLESLVRENPEDVALKLQLAAYYQAAQRPRKAIEVYTGILEKDAGEALALHGRADALLSVGRHADAIADYEKALHSQPDDSSLLNNFAWVLATSPDDKLRNGQRALELGTKACELTKYKESYILSTLAAAYAETGNFAKAVEWSTKAVETAVENAKDGDIRDQLRKELDSYKQSKPWREQQNLEEKPPAEKKAEKSLEKKRDT